MKLKEKLARLGNAGPGSAARRDGQEPSLLSPMPDGEGSSRRRRVRVERLRSLMGGVIARQENRLNPRGPREPVPLGELPGETRETPHGPLHLVDQYLEPAHRHGMVPVQGALTVDPSVVARLALDPAFEAVDPRGWLFLDTETTGLSGGTGTLPFLVGMAWFEDQSLRLQQLFLPRPGAEAPMLHALADAIRTASAIVSYNGKSFDWPLLRTRFVMNRVPCPPIPPHLDLLHAARRVYKGRLERVRLVHVEEEVLGMTREDDVDGSEIPGIYMKYLVGDLDPRMPGVIEHNANDLIALAAILAKVAEGYEERRVADDPRDCLGYARVAERAGDAPRAREFAEAAARGGGARRTTIEASLLAARVARRAGDVAGEGAMLALGLAAAGEKADLLAAEVRLALAKHHEHRTRDLTRTLEHAAHTVPAETVQERDKRVARVEARRDRCLAEGPSGTATSQ
ncbi:MAG: ribonuclease H-like domain-containing protein [Deltaproteobacteria bacterium]|nr:ribonuclease H-like domain-containing protein [Deltaproteobacteria bacterium]